MDDRHILWLASFPKSGNTWVASVLERAGCSFGYADGSYDAYHLEATGRTPSVTDCLDANIVPSPASILKTHAPYTPSGMPHRFPGVQPVSSAYIHVFRNPLDVLLSYIGFTRLEYRARRDDPVYRHRLFVELLGFPAAVDYADWTQMSIDRIPQANLDHALDAYGERGMEIPTIAGMCGSWIVHYRSWTRDASRLPGCSLRYEDCLERPDEFAKLSNLLVPGSGELVDGVAKANSRAERSAREGTERDRIFFSKRRAWYFGQYFSAGAVDRFVGRHAAALEETGYGDLRARARVPA